jgi:phenylpropionate dioxygenase-like ring-hydroxylating dioxygenase large terminal subunit
MSASWNLGRPLPPLDAALLPGKGRPDWAQCDAAFIDRALARALERSGGGWVVVDASSAITATPRRYDLAGSEWVAWRTDGEVVLAPNACPHLGAELCHGRVEQGKVVCPWHGLALGKRGHGDWQPATTYDDGVLLWARLLHDEEPTERPVVPARPSSFLFGAITMNARCEPQDVVANRLDPWHGAHFHPHSFASLTMTDVDEDVLKMRVAYKVVGRLVVEVDCTFQAPTRRSIVMTITGGDGVGSVVETHAAPISPGRSRLTEATIATSDRQGFAWMLRWQPLVRWFIETRARRLWVEDVAYAERRYDLRTRALPLPAAS